MVTRRDYLIFLPPRWYRKFHLKGNFTKIFQDWDKIETRHTQKYNKAKPRHDWTKFLYQEWDQDNKKLFFEQDETETTRTWNLSAKPRQDRKYWYLWHSNQDSCPSLTFAFFLLNDSISEFKRGLKMTLIEYLAGVGGYFSLPLGFSVISFIEIIYWLVVRLARNIVQN